MRDDKMPGRPSWSAGQMSMKSDVTGQIDSRFQLRHIARTAWSTKRYLNIDC
jgi:hypothetical protein